VEVELKLLLAGVQEAERLLASLPRPTRLEIQHNEYFDSPSGHWSRAGVALRLRHLDDHAVLTLKAEGDPGVGDSGIAQRPESEEEIDLELVRELRADSASLHERARSLAALAGIEVPDVPSTEELRVVGSMRTRRRVCELPEEFRTARHLEVDETTYPDGSVVWEVEMEASADTFEPEEFELDIGRLRRHFQRIDLPWRPSSLSKRARLERILRHDPT
jgi:uncharacterized protein YjbK